MRERWHIIIGIALALGLVCMCVAVPFLGLGGLCSLVALVPTPAPTPTPIEVFGASPIATMTLLLALTPAAVGKLGGSVTVGDIEFAVIEYLVPTEVKYLEATELGQPKPMEGAQYLALHVSAKNAGDIPTVAPSTWDVGLLYRGERMDHAGVFFIYQVQIDGQTIEQYEGGEMYPGVIREGWIFYFVPIVDFDASLCEVRVSFGFLEDRTWILK